MSNVELGFLEKCESWRLESIFFPSKVGGKPAWLSLKPLPTSEDLACQKCGKLMVFLCQVYAPYETTEDQQINTNFHRTLFVFICRSSNCNKFCDTENVKVFRSSLARENDFYSVDPPEEKKETTFDITKWAELCNLCGIFAQKRCSQCKAVAYCCRDHQVLDWKNGHKSICSQDLSIPVPVKNNNSKLLFSEWDLITETEELPSACVSEAQAMSVYKKLLAEGKTGTMEDVSEADLQAHASAQTDKVFTKFKKRIEEYPDQVIRYNRGTEPLLISSESLPKHIPDCEYCGGPRQFEFQIMPQMLFELKEHDLDWGVLLVYTCKTSCIGNSVNSYKKEYILKQDVSNSDLI